MRDGRQTVARVTFGLLVLVAAIVFVEWTIAFAGVRAEFPQTTVCLKEVGRLDGVLIGRTDQNNYVGEPEMRAALVAIEDDQIDSNISTGSAVGRLRGEQRRVGG